MRNWPIFVLIIGLTGACSPVMQQSGDSPVHIHKMKYSFPSPIHHFLLLDRMGFRWQNVVIPEKAPHIHSEYAYALYIGEESAQEIIFILSDKRKKALAAHQMILEHSSQLAIETEIRASSREYTRLLTGKSSRKLVLEKVSHIEQEIEAALVKHKRQELAVLVDIGAWIEGLYIITKELSVDYRKDLSMLLHEAHIADLYHEALVELIEKKQLPSGNRLVANVDIFLTKVRQITLPQKDKPIPLTKVKQILKLTSWIRSEIRQQ